MSDLSKYKAVKHMNSRMNRAETEIIPRMLTNEGWELLSVKIVEEQTRIEVHQVDGGPWVQKKGIAHYILGLRRDFKTKEECGADLRLRELHGV